MSAVTACRQQKGQGYRPERICFPGGVALAADQGSIRRGRRSAQADGGHRRVDRPVAELPEYRALKRRDDATARMTSGVSEESRQHSQRQQALRSRTPAERYGRRIRRPTSASSTGSGTRHQRRRRAWAARAARRRASRHRPGRYRATRPCPVRALANTPPCAMYVNASEKAGGDGHGYFEADPVPKGVDAGARRPGAARAASRRRETAGQPNHFHRDRRRTRTAPPGTPRRLRHLRQRRAAALVRPRRLRRPPGVSVRSRVAPR
jgi:hypothetical protein